MGSRDFESGKQELKSEFYKYQISTKNRIFMANFFNISIFGKNWDPLS
jgi:hypothetical protein